MARPFTTKISIADFEFVLEYLMLLAQSNRAFKEKIPLFKSVNRVRLYSIALALEKAMLSLRDKAFTAEIDRLCLELEEFMVSMLSKPEIKKLKVAVRQKRFKFHFNEFNRLLQEYQRNV